MINIGIYTKDDKILRTIGEELIRERHQGLNFYLVTHQDFLSGDLIVARREDGAEISAGRPVYLTEDLREEGIFLFQSKEKIKEQILSAVYGEKGMQRVKSRIRLIQALTFADEYTSTVFSHLLATELAGEGRKVCFISLNLFFPFGCIHSQAGNNGLLKALYYQKNGQEINLGIISFSEEFRYHYIGNDLNFDEFKEMNPLVIEEIAGVLEREGFDDLVLDYSREGLELLRNSARRGDLNLLLGVADDPLSGCQEEGLLATLPELVIHARGPLVTRDRSYSYKGGRLEQIQGSEEMVIWKGILKEKYRKS